MKHPTLSIGLTDQEIIEGLRHRDSQLTRFYFYDTCRVAVSYTHLTLPTILRV